MDALNVSQFLTAYNASLANVLELKTSTITGILKPKGDKIYGRGDLFWEVVDGGARLTVRMPVRYRHLQERRVAVIGQPTRRLGKNHGDIQIILDVEHVTPLDPTPDDWMGPLRLIGEQRQSLWPGIERSIETLIRAGERPRVLIFFSSSSNIDKDVDAGLRPYGQAYDIDKRPIPLTDPPTVVAALSGGNIDANLVAIVRGGGDMPALSDRQVIEAVAHHTPVPIVSAVGHDVDQPLIQDVVHQVFSAPTAFGTWLADRAKGAIHAREAMALDHTRALEAMQRQLTELTDVITAAKLAETTAREAAAQAREETGALRRDLQKSESGLRHTQEQVLVLWRRLQRMRVFLFIALGILAFMLVALWGL
jgi:hypothetical protein